MDLALTINGWIDEEIIFAQQIGARQVFARVDGGQGAAPGWDAQSLARLANRIEKAGLVLAGLHAAAAPAGGGGQDELLAWAARLAQEAGAAGLGLLSLSTALLPPRRPAEKPLAVRLAPLAEAADRARVMLAIPAAALLKERVGSQAQGSLEKALKTLPPSVGLDGSPRQVQGWLEKTAPGSAPRHLILEKLRLVSYGLPRRPAGVQGGAGIDELLPVSWRLRQAGYLGLIRLEPARWKGDTPEGHHARAFTTGYLRGVLQAFQKAETAG